MDPLADKYVYNSPYAFSENHVVAHVELEGLEKFHFMAAEFSAHQKGKIVVANNQVYRDENVYNKNYADSPDGGNFKEINLMVESSNGEISNIDYYEGGDSFGEEFFDLFTSGDVNNFDFNISGTDNENGSTIQGTIEDASFTVSVKIEDGKMTFSSSLSGGETDNAYSLKAEGASSFGFTVGSLQAGREEGTVNQTTVTVPFTVDENGQTVFDKNVTLEYYNEDENRSTKQ